ncbi:GNAT family N-acetyltransferase [Shimia abyssi]|uniref:Acetyltransferase (GNAT) family protein n=1 Tax=Shimia abyssi TaxID=1662395 RepID=A0A2P8FKH2_9RHOB|nr:GNAT family N-acetyltransferase [Shimia abyssi]PSL22224.1 acetyltransferase (GNAT) family protein [Shimia abyssi]
MRDITVTPGFTDSERPQVVDLYWQAFSGKLGLVMRPTKKALAFFNAALNPDFALVARDHNGLLLGVVGFKTAKGALVDAGYSEMARHYGHFGTLWRVALLALLERDTVSDTLLMDGIFVAASARGRGVGTILLNAIKAEAVHRSVSFVRLDVIDTNPRARALYEREGFKPTGVEHLGPLRLVFGFKSSTKMVWRVET